MHEKEVMSTMFEPSDGNSRVLIIDNNSAFTHRASLLLQHTRHYVVREENDERMLIVGRLCEAAIDWRLTQTPYKLFFKMEVLAAI
jgi:hypothetical protein